MLGKHQSLKAMTWGKHPGTVWTREICRSDGQCRPGGFVNWTMLTAMSYIWSALLKHICPGMKGPRPENLFRSRRSRETQWRKTSCTHSKLIAAFSKPFRCHLGLMKKKSYEMESIWA